MQNKHDSHASLTPCKNFFRIAAVIIRFTVGFGKIFRDVQYHGIIMTTNSFKFERDMKVELTHSV